MTLKWISRFGQINCLTYVAIALFHPDLAARPVKQWMALLCTAALFIWAWPGPAWVEAVRDGANRLSLRAAMWAVIGLLVVASSLPVAAQSAADLRELERLSDERGKARGEFLRSREGRGRSPAPGSTPQEVVRPLAGVWICAGAEPNDPVLAEPSARAPVMGRTMEYVATQGRQHGPFLEVLHSNGHLGYVLLDGVMDAAGNLRPYEPPEGVAARQCRVEGVRASDGTLVFSFR